MMRTLTHEEELAMRKADFEKLCPFCLFDLSSERYFIVVRRIHPRSSWEKRAVLVVELTPENRKKILFGKKVEHTVLRFDEMSCLNVR